MQAEHFRRRLHEIEAAVLEWSGELPRGLVSTTAPAVQIASVELELGVPIPEEVSSLYRATGFVDCFVDFLAPLPDLVPLNVEAKLHVDEVYALFSDRIWGTKPTGDIVFIGRYAGHLNFVEVDGPSAGRLSALDVTDDFGYRFLADSVEHLLDAWIAATTRGLFELLPSKTVVSRETDELQLRDLAAEYGVGPVAFGIYHLTPSQYSRWQAGEPNFWLD